MYNPQAKPEKLLLLICPLDYIEVDYKIYSLQRVKKKDTHQTAMQKEALATIHTLASHLCRWFCLSDKNGNARVGIQ